MSRQNYKKDIKQKRKEERRLNKQTLVTTIIFSLIFVFMLGYYVHFVLKDAPTVISSSQNGRIKEQAKKVVRGSILAKDGEELAYTDTNGTDDDFEDDARRYPYGKVFAQVIGYTTKGFTGLEDVCNYDLVMPKNNALKQIEDDFTGKVLHGCNIQTTLDVDLQKTAYNSLGDFKGGIIVMDPDTGAIYVSASKPSYNPENLEENWKKLNKKADAPFMNRSTQGRYMPGSVFKIVTTLAYMRQNSDYKNYNFQCNGTKSFDHFQLECYHGTVHGNETLEEAFANSCNGAFASMGLEIDTDIFNQTAEDLLFNNPLPIADLKTSTTSYVKSGSFELDEKSEKYNDYYVAESSIGQQDVLVSPAQMVLIASAIANDGVMMKPYLISQVMTDDGDVVQDASQSEAKTLMTKKEAKQLSKYMGAVCEYGTAKIFANSEYKAYGKTGTADLSSSGDGKVNSWFVGFAKKGGKKLAIAVVLENINDSEGSAKECAKKVFDRYFN